MNECVSTNECAQRLYRPESGVITSVLNLVRLAKEFGVIQEPRERSSDLDEGSGPHRRYPEVYVCRERPSVTGFYYRVRAGAARFQTDVVLLVDQHPIGLDVKRRLKSGVAVAHG
jgi:hypothetical protein